VGTLDVLHHLDLEGGVTLHIHMTGTKPTKHVTTVVVVAYSASAAMNPPMSTLAYPSPPHLIAPTWLESRMIASTPTSTRRAMRSLSDSRVPAAAPGHCGQVKQDDVTT
jgi:hypothetical protein